MSNTKLERIKEMEKQLAALKAEVEAESKVEEWQPKGGDCYVSIPKYEYKNFGLRYETGEQVKKAIGAMRSHNRLLAYVTEFDEGWEADWSDENQVKYCIYFDGRSGEYKVDEWLLNNYTGAVYMSEECAEGLVEKLNKGIVKL